LVWVAAIAGIAVVAALMVWLGRGGEITFRGFRFSLRESRPQGVTVSVADKLAIRDGEAGDIVGIDAQGVAPADAPVSVARNARLTNAKVGDIVGVRASKSTKDPT
jgi:hypothetical protein